MIQANDQSSNIINSASVDKNNISTSIVANTGLNLFNNDSISLIDTSSSSFSKLNNENIVQMINQAQLLSLNEEVSQVATASVNNFSNNINNPNFIKNNKHSPHFNTNNNQNSFGNNKTNRSFQFKSNTINRFMNPSMINRNGNYQQLTAPSLLATPPLTSTTPQSYIPFGFNQQNSFFMQPNLQQSHSSFSSNHHHQQHIHHQHQNQSQMSTTPPSYFYNTNSFNNKQNMNYRSYLQAKKAENMHKLWPHSVKNQTTNSKDTSKNKNSDQLTIPTEQNEKNIQITTNTNSESNQTSETNAQSDSKTPMCLINELVKYNKIKHEYMLLDEIGPAHKKKFFVSLKLGLGSDNEETFTANSTSIKKAQHAAAELALKQTKYKKPIKRSNNNNNNTNDPTKFKTFTRAANQEYYRKKANPALAPTVLLNALAMKLGLVANYSHTMTSMTNNIDLSLNTMCSNKPTAESNTQSNDQENEQNIKKDLTTNTSFTSDLNQSFETKSNNYTNFTNSEYEPFKYPQDQLVKNDQIDPNSKINESISNPNQIKVLTNPNKDLFNLNRNNNTNYKGLSRIKKKNDNLKQFFFVKLKFADVEFSGEGIALQTAKHDAASKALSYFNNPENFLKAKNFSAQNKSSKAYRPPQFYNQSDETNKKNTSEETANKNENKNPSNEKKTDESKEKSTKFENESTSNVTEDLKSEIMLVHEYACHLKKNVTFELMQESGPPHKKKYVTKCSIGKKVEKETTKNAIEVNDKAVIPTAQTSINDKNDLSNAYESCYFEAIGEGNSKKISKKNSAIEILKILKEKFEPLFMISSKKQNHKDASKENNGEQTSRHSRKGKSKNIVKIKKTNLDYGKGSINPVSRLMQIQQAKKDAEPEFTLIMSNNNFNKSRKTEFIIQCSLTRTSVTTNDNNSTQETSKILEKLQCEGKGPTKKLAKQNAAEAMLVKLGYQNKVVALKPSIKNTTSSATISTSNPTSQVASTELDINNKQNVDLTDTSEKINSEKRVTFLEENNVTFQISDNKSGAEKKQKENKKTLTQQQQQQNYHQQKIKSIKDQLKINNEETSTVNDFDKKKLEIVYQIASELLESLRKKKENETSIDIVNNSSSENKSDNVVTDFYSATAEKILQENSSSDISKLDHFSKETEKETEEKKIHFKILNGNNNDINYKSALDYLGMVMKFKINYQSLLGRDKNVCSYVNLSILPETEKPLNGQGLTHIESSNAAALCALQYLASKLQKSD